MPESRQTRGRLSACRFAARMGDRPPTRRLRRPRHNPGSTGGPANCLASSSCRHYRRRRGGYPITSGAAGHDAGHRSSATRRAVRPGRPPLADITTPSHSLTPFVSTVITEARFVGARARTACPSSRPNKPNTVRVVRPDGGSATACEPLSWCWCCQAPCRSVPKCCTWWWCWRVPHNRAPGLHRLW